MKESWQAVVGYSGFYEVSDQGRVRSLDRTVCRTDRWGNKTTVRLKGRVLKPGSTRNGGRKYVDLSKGNKPWVVCVHVLVAAAFIGPRPEGLEIDHVDGNYLNNSAGNLEYVTRGENARRAYAMGLLKPPKNDLVRNSKGQFQLRADA